MLKNTNIDLQSSDRKLQQELNSLREKLLSLTSKHTSETRCSKLELKSRESEQEELRKDRDRLQAQLVQATQIKVTTENDTIRGQVAILTKKLAYSQSDELEAKENLEAYRTEIFRLKETIARLQSKGCLESCRPGKDPGPIQIISPLCSPLHIKSRTDTSPDSPRLQTH